MTRTTANNNDPKFILRLPPELKEDVKAAAKVAGRSMNSECLSRLSARRQEVSEKATTQSLRDWFAGQALAGLLAAHDGDTEFPTFDEAAPGAFEYADAMLKAREQ